MKDTMARFYSLLNVPSTIDSFDVSGSLLQSDITIDAPANFELSTQSSSGFGPQLVLLESNHSVPLTKIYVRYRPTQNGLIQDTLFISSSNAPTRKVGISGDIFPPKIIVSRNQINHTLLSRIGSSSGADTFSVSAISIS